jgi:hypothetical protein
MNETQIERGLVDQIRLSLFLRISVPARSISERIVIVVEPLQIVHRRIAADERSEIGDLIVVNGCGRVQILTQLRR